MKLPRITKKQEEILRLLYNYRFLNRIQIQRLMGHKDKKTINLWLRDLREKEYVEWIYSTDFTEKTKPAVYYTGLNGVRLLKTLVNEAGTEYLYVPAEVRKRYREYGRSESFVTRSVLLADCCINFTSKSDSTTRYTCTTQSEYIDPDHEFHFLTNGDLESQLGPQLIITKQHDNGNATNYLLEIFDTSLPRYRMKNRLKQYVTFLTEGDWEAERADDPLPIVLLVCPRTTDLIYAKRRTRGLLANTWDEEKPKIRFTTVEKLKKNGVITGSIWEDS
jgi:hypothetical protein